LSILSLEERFFIYVKLGKIQHNQLIMFMYSSLFIEENILYCLCDDLQNIKFCKITMCIYSRREKKMKKFNKVVLGLLCAMLMTGCGASEGGEASKNDIPQGLTGSYAGKDSWGYQQVFVFYDGTYVWYNEEIDIENVFEVGSYELKDDSTIVCYSIDGESFEYDMKYDNAEDSIIFNEEDLVIGAVGSVSTYQSDDKQETLDISVSGNYISEFENKIQNKVEYTASQCSDYARSYIDIDYDSLNDPEDEFFEILARELDFDNDTTLQFMLQTETIDAIQISTDDVSQLSFMYQ